MAPRRLSLLLAGILATLGLTAAAAASAKPAPPGPPTGPAFVGTPYVVLDAPGRLTLYARLARPVERRFDGEARGSAIIDGRIASLREVPGRRAGQTACYAADAVAASGRIGRVVSVSIVLDGPPQRAVSAFVAVRAPRPGDGRGAPLRC